MRSSATILVVDDDEDIRAIVIEILRDEGYTVDEAENGRVALDQILAMRELPCLVLLDMMMPTMSGTELLEALAVDSRLAAMPVVMVTAQNDARAPGARSILRKPLSREALLAVVARYASTRAPEACA